MSYDKVDPDQNIMDYLAERSVRNRKKMEHVRSFKRKVAPKKWSDEKVSELRTAFKASQKLKGFSLAMLSVYFSMPISTVHKFCYDSTARRATAAQANKQDIAKWKAIFNSVLLKHAESEARLKQDRESAKYRPLSVGEAARAAGHKAGQEELIPEATEQDYVDEENAHADQVVFDAIDAILGNAIRSPNNIAEAVNYHVKTSGKYSSPRELIQLRRKYSTYCEE